MREHVGYSLIHMHFSLQRSEDKRGAGEITDCFTVCSWARTLQPPPFMSTSTCYCRNLGQKVVCKLCVPDTERHRVSATIVTALSQPSILFFPAFPSIAHSSTFSLPLFLLPCYFPLAESLSLGVFFTIAHGGLRGP